MKPHTYFVVMERKDDPKGEKPIFVGESREAAIAARDLRMTQEVGIHQIIRQNRFDAGENCGGRAIPEQFMHRFEIVEVPASCDRFLVIE